MDWLLPVLNWLKDYSPTLVGIGTFLKTLFGPAQVTESALETVSDQQKEIIEALHVEQAQNAAGAPLSNPVTPEHLQVLDDMVVRLARIEALYQLGRLALCYAALLLLWERRPKAQERSAPQD